MYFFLSVTLPYTYRDMDWNCFVLENIWSVDDSQKCGSFYIFFPQKLDIIYARKWISDTWIMAVSCTLLYSSVFHGPGDVILSGTVSVLQSTEEHY
jgi:hypothetical protein